MDRIKLANRIKSERHKKNFSQKQLATLTGINNTVISRIENAEKEVSVENLIKISKALGVDVEYMLFDQIPENLDALSHSLLNQICKLNPHNKKLFCDIMIILLENHSIWMEPSNPEPTGNAVNFTEIGKRIRYERLKKDLTQETLAEKAEITDNFLSLLETGHATMSLDILFKIANALDVPITKLLINADTKEPNASLAGITEGLSYTNDKQSRLLIDIVAVLIDNSDKW